MPAPPFDASFSALTGYSPMRWQARLFRRMVDGAIPPACDLPTGLGKTSVIPIWLIALVSRVRTAGSPPFPRRLVYIVNRRTVVDQATAIVERMRERLWNPEDPRWAAHKTALNAIRRELRAFQATADGDELLGVSTLRGELADNEEWKADPSRPAIIVGTIDMVGSKLLFSGYGDGRYRRVHHAGLMGQDVLIVHDEAHLTPAFNDLLLAVVAEQRREVERNNQGSKIGRPIKVFPLSATLRESGNDIFTLEPEDYKDPIVQERLTAAKRLHLHSVPEDKVVEKIVAQSRTHEAAGVRVLIYVRSPEQAQQIAAALKKVLETASQERIALLTGTIRGHERDQLMQQPPASSAAHVIRHFLDGTKPKSSVYLISTSAGEVGIDLDADHMVCDLTALDAMIQRLGRVNRRGGKDRHACVDVVGDAPAKDKPSEFDNAIMATLGILKRWEGQQTGGIDVSPGSMRRLIEELKPTEREAAFSPKPEAPPLTDILLDAWSLTSIAKMPGRPEVAPYLHGLTAHGLTAELPETYVVWRKEIIPLKQADASAETLHDWFSACEIETQERLRGRTDSVQKTLEGLLASHHRRGTEDFPVVLLDERGNADWSKLSRLAEKDSPIAYRTAVLPVEAGGLDAHGTLDSSATEPAPDVAEARTGNDRRERWIVVKDTENVEYRRLLTDELAEDLPPGLDEQERIILAEQAEGADGTGKTRELVLLVSPRKSALENPEIAKVRQTLVKHTRLIESQMAQIAQALGLEKIIQEALVTAARWHDKGKDRPVWQRFARNAPGAEPVAKSKSYLHPRALGGYRHEFGSLLDATNDETLRDCPERDLILHLIAAHHGWARPHFEPRAFDHLSHTTAENEQAAIEVIRRFGRLQQRFGRWGLAWLESLLRCADIAASKPLPVEKNMNPTQHKQEVRV